MKRILLIIALLIPKFAEAQGSLLPDVLQQFTDTLGVPIASGYVCATISGTSTNLPVYPTAADANAGTNAYTNPVQLDSAGRKPIWMGTGTYRIIVFNPVGVGSGTCNGTPTGSAVKTVDGVAGYGSLLATNNTWTGTNNFTGAVTASFANGTICTVPSFHFVSATTSGLAYNSGSQGPQISNCINGLEVFRTLNYGIEFVTGLTTGPDGSSVAGVHYNYINGLAGTSITVQSSTPVQAATSVKGTDLFLWSSDALAGSSVGGAAQGGVVHINAGDSKRLTSGTANGGDIYLKPGGPVPTNGALPGNVTMAHGRVGIGIADGVQPVSALEIKPQVDGLGTGGSTNDGVTITTGAGTADFYRTMVNSHQTNFGGENSSGGVLFTGASAYAGVAGTAGADPFEIFTNNTKRGTFGATGGLAVGTATLSYFLNVGLPTSASSEGMNVAATANTTGAYYRAYQTVGMGYFGVENNTGGAIFSGSAGNATVLGSFSAHPVEFYENNTKVMSITGPGQVVITSMTSASTGDYVCYNTSNGNLTQGTATCTLSSERYKHDFDDQDVKGLDDLMKVKTYSFVRNNHPELGRTIGLKAEDMAQIDPRIVIFDDHGRPDKVLYENFTAWLAKAVQDLNRKVERLEKQ